MKDKDFKLEGDLVKVITNKNEEEVFEKHYAQSKLDGAIMAKESAEIEIKKYEEILSQWK